jgi:hypothetical protein
VVVGEAMMYLQTAGHSSSFSPFADISLPSIARWPYGWSLDAVLLLIACWSSDACMWMDSSSKEAQREVLQVNHDFSALVHLKINRSKEHVEADVPYHRNRMWVQGPEVTGTLWGKVLQHRSI